VIGRRVLAAALLAAAAAAGCSDADQAAPPPVTTPPAPTADKALSTALLTEGDLPLGFRAQDGGADAAALGCAGIDGVYVGDGLARAAASFAHASSPAYVNETLTTRPGGAAGRALAAFRAAATDCATFAGPDGTAYRVSAVSLPAYGDASAALRVTSGIAEGRPVELAAVQVGDTVVAIAAAGTGAGDAALTRTVVDRALAKLTATR
jgi:hypothetical protein